MSYDLMFTTELLPEDKDEAWEEFDDREEFNEESQAQPHPKLIKLIEELSKKYPCPTKLIESEIDNSLWSDAPILNNIIGNTLILSASFSAIDDAYDFIKDTSKLVNVIFLDPQKNEIYIP
jgi:hypothetical protein